MSQSWIATVALLAWPLIGFGLYRTLPFVGATIWVTLGAFLLLPVGASVKIAAGIPQLDKVSVPALTVLAACIVLKGRPPRLLGPSGLAAVLVLLYMSTPIVSGLLNPDEIVAGIRVLPAVGLYDGVSAAVGQIFLIVPFLVARQFFREQRSSEQVLRALVASALLYSLLILLEVRLSPQLHTWIYGFFQSNFNVEIRYGGFRPVVFLDNGLTLAIFVATSFFAATVLVRLRRPTLGLPSELVAGYLGLVLIACKSAGAILLGVVFSGLAWITHPRLQLRIAVILVLVTVAYPLMSLAKLSPAAPLVELFESIDRDRAFSLQFRLEHEARLLEHASERFLFGWGRFGRNRVYDEWGSDVSITDGRWIIVLGQFGFTGFLAEFGLLAFCVFRAAAAARRLRNGRELLCLAALSLIVAITLIDQLPNATLSPWTWLLGGSILGRAEALSAMGRKSDVTSALRPATRAPLPQAGRPHG